MTPLLREDAVMTREEIAEIDALYAKATKGLWGAIGNVVDIPGGGIDRQSLHLNTSVNAKLIVALVNAWPRLRETLLRSLPGVGCPVPDVDWLANVIRANDGNHAAGCRAIGAGVLAEKIINAMSGLPGVGWIPVSERLPENGDEVVLLYASSMNGSGIRTGMIIGHTNKIWHIPRYEHEIEGKPTHWMPLPARPEGDSHDR